MIGPCHPKFGPCFFENTYVGIWLPPKNQRKNCFIKNSDR